MLDVRALAAQLDAFSRTATGGVAAGIPDAHDRMTDSIEMLRMC